jgi:uncharacterized protein (TIGR02117 family)
MNRKIVKTIKVLLKYILFFLTSIIVYTLCVISIAYIPVNANVEPCKSDCVEVYLRSNGVHTDIVLPIKNELKDWTIQLDSKLNKAGKSNFNYVSVGWGDKGFYLDTPTWGDLTFRTAFNALFYLSSSAMHITFLDSLTEGVHCKKVFISKENYAHIVAFVESSFQSNETNQYIRIPNVSYGQDDIFYEAKGRYSLFYTCNSWTNNCLKSGNMKACLWTVLDKGFFYHYK